MAIIEILIRSASDDVIDALADLLSSGDTLARLNALSVLSGIQSDESLSLIVSALGDKNSSVRYRASDAIAKSKSDVVFRLLERCLKSSNWNLKLGTIRTLGLIGSDDSIDLLEKLLKEDNISTKVAVLEVLAGIGSRRCLRIIMNNAKLRWGILGAARINQQLMPAIVEARNSELVAIASRRPGAAAKTLAQYAPEQKNVTLYDSPEALLDDNSIQAVYIPLATHEHASWTLRAIAKGKHVLCEKPMAIKVSDIEAIAAAAQQHNVTVMEGFMYRFHPQHLRVQEIIDSGVIGEVRSVRSCFSYMMQPARHYRIADTIAADENVFVITKYVPNTGKNPNPSPAEISPRPILVK
jgi:hypothetical protein